MSTQSSDAVYSTFIVLDDWGYGTLIGELSHTMWLTLLI